jgi:hypothetical protein
VIWTNNTVWAKGVEREIQICHEARILEALFLEQGSIVPKLYVGTTIEYTRFDANNPGKAFSKGLKSLRLRLQSRSNLLFLAKDWVADPWFYQDRSGLYFVLLDICKN